MKKSFLYLICVVVFRGAAGQSAEHEQLTVEPNHSTIGFSVQIGGGLTRVTGKFLDYDLKFNYVAKDLRLSTVNFTINASSINTYNKERDDHLRAEDFLDIEKYPQITFASSRITGEGKKFTMEGVLSIRGVERNVTIPLELLSADKPVALQIRMPLNRKDYGVGNGFRHTIMENFLPDSIDVEINLWTKRDKR